MNLDGSKWSPKLLDLRTLKRFFTTWQKGLYGKGWNSLYWNNHDQPRIVSRWGNDSLAYRVISAKMLATCLHFLCGTPYIYQGEEIGKNEKKRFFDFILIYIGMTNVRFSTLAEYRDIETLNFHRDAVRQGLSLEEIMAGIYAKSRDNARTPMQWSGQLPYGGFTNGAVDVAPWIGVNPNYTDINVEQALNDPQSIFYYYQKLLELRRRMPIIVRGKYDILHEEDTHIFMYKRYNDEGEELIIACNFNQQPIKIDDAELSQKLKKHKRLLISNYEQDNKSDWLDFRPYEAWALEIS
jgi:oligo-1,6-glucosidase